jgi:iron complex transport system ATP-binding protein
VGEEPAALELRGVSARYPFHDAWQAGAHHGGPPYRSALHEVSLTVRAGEVFAVLGPNGAGKSTLLRVASGLLAPDGGQVRCFGRDLARIDRRTLARDIAVVSQSDGVAAGFRVREVVAMGRAPHQDGWMRERDSDRAAVEDALARCELTAYAHRRVDALSGGEQRRVALARALAQRPRVLLLDEPAAFFDVRHRLALAALIADLVARDGIAALVALHDLDEAARLASQVLLLRDGRTVAMGPPALAMTPARLRETFDADIDVGVHPQTGRPFFVPRT